MPVVAVGAAIFAGYSAATVGLVGLGVMGSIAAVGTIMVGVGVVTKNKNLVKIGGVMAIVGGVGAIMQRAGAFGAGDVMQSFDNTGATMGADAGSWTSDAGGGDYGYDIPNVSPTTTGPDLAPQTAAATTVGGGSTVAPGTPALPPGAGGAPAAGGGLGLESILKWAEPVTKFAKDNQLLTYGAFQVGGNLIQGLMVDPAIGQAQIANADAQTRALNQRTDAQAAPLPVASIDPNNPYRVNYGKPGILNAPPAQTATAANVTGAPLPLLQQDKSVTGTPLGAAA